MAQSNIDVLNSFDVNSIPNLDTVVLGALELFNNKSLPSINLQGIKHPLVVGSGNAEATGKIIFETADAIFASESNFLTKLQNIKTIDEVVLISASGGKHAPKIAKQAVNAGKHVTLFTNNASSLAQNAVPADKITTYVYPKNREPYTYNTSTYLSMILGKTGESPSQILQFIQSTIDSLDLPDFSIYDKFYIIVPPQFSGIVRMLQVKFIELFGRKIARDVETSEYVRHATTVAPENELFISFGEPNDTWGSANNRLFVPLPDNAGYGAMLAVSYYIVGKIQAAHEPYFKQNIVEYCQFISGVFGEDIRPIAG